jgi:hypothetical protein
MRSEFYVYINFPLLFPPKATGKLSPLSKILQFGNIEIYLVVIPWTFFLYKFDVSYSLFMHRKNR